MYFLPFCCFNNINPVDWSWAGCHPLLCLICFVWSWWVAMNADTLEVHSHWKLCILPLNTSCSACTHLPLTVKLLPPSSVLLMWAVGLIGLWLCHSAEWWNILGLNLFKQTPNLIRFEIFQMICDIEFSIVLNNLVPSNMHVLWAHTGCI